MKQLNRFVIISLVVVLLGISLYFINPNKIFDLLTPQRNEPIMAVYRIPNAGETFTLKIMESPLQADRVWIHGDGLALEFNTKTKEWQDLRNYFGKFARELSFEEDKIIKDPFQENIIWLYLSHQGIMEYDISSRTKRFVFTPDGDAVEGVLPDRTGLWIGTSQGLFRYDRRTRKVHEIKYFQGIWIKKIALEEGQLWINGELIYDPATEQVKSVLEIPQFPLKKISYFQSIEGYKVLGDDDETVILDKQDQIQDFLKELRFDTIIPSGDDWFIIGNRTIKYNVTTGKSVALDDRPAYAAQLVGAHLYLKAFDGLVSLNTKTLEQRIFPKRGINDFMVYQGSIWIIVPGSLIRIDEAKSEAVLKPITVLDQMRLVQEQLDNILKKARLQKSPIQKIKEYAKAIHFMRDNQAMIAGSPSYDYSIKPDLRIFNVSEIQQLKQFIQKSDDSLEKELAQYILATSPLILGEPLIAYENYLKLKKNYPKGINAPWIYKEDLKKLSRAAKEFEKIRQIKSEEERLWRLGELFDATHQVSWNVDEGYTYNLSYSNSLFNKLLTKYPAGQWSDNAGNAPNFGDEALIHEGGFATLDCNGVYQRFINKYPNSELIPDARLAMAYHYQSLVEELAQGMNYIDNAEVEAPEILEYLNNAKVIYQEIVAKYPKRKDIAQIKENLQIIKVLIDRYSWLLEISSSQTLYAGSEKVALSFVLKNTALTEKSLDLFAEPRNFGLIIKYKKPGNDYFEEVPLILGDQQIFKGSRKQKIIPANGTYIEVQRPQEEGVRPTSSANFSSWEYGRFMIDKPGAYKARAYYQFDNNSLPCIYSNEISFTVN